MDSKARKSAASQIWCPVSIVTLKLPPKKVQWCPLHSSGRNEQHASTQLKLILLAQKVVLYGPLQNGFSAGAVRSLSHDDLQGPLVAVGKPLVLQLPQPARLCLFE